MKIGGLSFHENIGGLADLDLTNKASKNKIGMTDTIADLDKAYGGINLESMRSFKSVSVVSESPIDRPKIEENKSSIAFNRPKGGSSGYITNVSNLTLKISQLRQENEQNKS